MRKFENINLSKDTMLLIENFKLKCENLDFVLKKITKFSDIELFGWKLYFEEQRHCYKYIAGVWRLHLNNKLSEDLADGSATTEEIAQTIQEALNDKPFADLIVDAAEMAMIITEFSHLVWKENNHGNGTIIRFAAWTIPDDIQPSYHKW